MQPESWRKVLGWYHAVAGAAGIAIGAVVAPQVLGRVPPPHRWGAGMMFLGIGIVFGLVLAAGVLLLRGSAYGRPLALLLQVAQIPLLGAPPYLWIFYAGLYLAPVWTPDGVTLLLGAKANLEATWGVTAGPTLLGINLVPIGILWLLRRKLPSNEALQLTSALG